MEGFDERARALVLSFDWTCLEAPRVTHSKRAGKASASRPASIIINKESTAAGGEPRVDSTREQLNDLLLFLFVAQLFKL